MKEWMELVDYRITEGSDYCWSCYGNNAYSLDSWDGDQDGHSFTIIFDQKTQEVFEVQAHDYLRQRAYRMINPDYVEQHRAESNQRDVNLNEAWDDVDYVDLEVDDDFIQKCLAIHAGEDYSTDITLPIDLPDDLLMFAFKAAHAENMTFNDWMNQMLRRFVDKVNAGEFTKDDVKDEFLDLYPFPVERKKKKKKKSTRASD
jgi:hypothetical protein